MVDLEVLHILREIADDCFIESLVAVVSTIRIVSVF